MYNFIIRKKINLEKLNLVELDAQEVKETEGGILPLIVVGACLLLASCGAKKAPVGLPPTQGGN